jgi:hypothetical protein
MSYESNIFESNVKICLENRCVYHHILEGKDRNVARRIEVKAVSIDFANSFGMYFFTWP